MENKKVELIQKVNAVANGNVFGTKEIDEVVDLAYEVCEEIEATKEGEPLSVIDLLGELGMPLVKAVSGVKGVSAEAADLKDEEVLASVNRGDNFQLGDNALKYKQAVKLLLFGVQSVFVFKS
ncbi:MAG TPA: hypothetical protein VE912_08890 [Bacteroidales bacterium]|nr:hypothetical protein [Bacteroidales bacterium]